MDAVGFFSPSEVIAAAKAIHRFRRERFSQRLSDVSNSVFPE
jgi:hypothetical protein